MFKNKTLLITGGTGTFGNAVLQAFLDTGIKEIRIFSVMKKNRIICAKHTLCRSQYSKKRVLSGTTVVEEMLAGHM